MQINNGLVTGSLKVLGKIFAPEFKGNLVGNVTGNVSGSSGSCTGNAGTATKLQTPRTLTIGNTGKSFDGSNNVSWSLSEIGAQASGSYLNTNGTSSMTGDLKFDNASHIYWSNGTYRQRIFITDDSTANTNVFNFLQSINSGSTWTDLFKIQDNGNVIANTVTASSAMAITSGKVSISANTSKLYSNGLAISNPGTANDTAWIRCLGTSENDTVLEIAVGDDGNSSAASSTRELIVARQYGTDNAVKAEAIILGKSAETSFPGTLKATNLIKTELKTLSASGNRTSTSTKASILRIWGPSYGNTATDIIGTKKLSYGDGGPLIQFSTDETAGLQVALIYTDHDTIATGASLSLVSDLNNVSFITLNVLADKFVKTGGTSSLFLKANGSVDSNTYATTSSLNNYILKSTIYKTAKIKSIPSSGTEHWYSIFNVRDVSNTPILCIVRAYAHSSIVFTVCLGYDGAGVINVLNYCSSSNGSYPFIKGVRKLTNGNVELKLNKPTNDCNYELAISVIGNASVDVNYDLIANTAASTVASLPVLDSNGITASSLRSNLLNVDGKIITNSNVNVSITTTEGTTSTATTNRYLLIYTTIPTTATSTSFTTYADYNTNANWHRFNQSVLVNNTLRTNQLLVGNNATSNYISFYGTTGDNPGAFNHTYIGERIYSGSECSELVLFKGNDIGASASTPSGSGSDRIRHVAGAHLFQTYTSALSGAFETVATSSVLKNILEINSSNILSFVPILMKYTVSGTYTLTNITTNNTKTFTISPNFKIYHELPNTSGTTALNSVTSRDSYTRFTTDATYFYFNKTISGTITNSNAVGGYSASKLTKWQGSSSGSMNDVATYGSCIGMVLLSLPSSADTDAKKKTINPNMLTGWHHFINLSYVETSGNNMWQTLIANAAGTTDLWVRSRNGGQIVDGADWQAPWVKILTLKNFPQEELNCNIITKNYTNVVIKTNWDENDSKLNITGNTISNDGTYIVQVKVTDSNNAGSKNMIYSGVMSWFANATSDNDEDEIILHGSGKVLALRIYLKVKQTTSNLKLLIASSEEFTASTLSFKFKRII